MKNQVNLYLPHLRKQHIPLATRTLLRLWAGLAMVLVVLSGLEWQATHRLTATVEQLRAGERDAMERLSSMAASHRPPSPDPALERRLAQLEQEQRNKQSLLSLLKGNELGNPVGFSPFLVALARHHEPVFWFTGITLAAGGRDLQLVGETTSADALFGFFQRLGQETVLAGREFAVLELQREPATAPTLRFVVREKAGSTP